MDERQVTQKKTLGRNRTKETKEGSEKWRVDKVVGHTGQVCPQFSRLRSRDDFERARVRGPWVEKEAVVVRSVSPLIRGAWAACGFSRLMCKKKARWAKLAYEEECRGI